VIKVILAAKAYKVSLDSKVYKVYLVQAAKAFKALLDSKAYKVLLEVKV